MERNHSPLIRRCRPKHFKEVVGQEAVVQTLQNAISMDRVAQAYLFCGSHGTGKTTLARLFAKAINCPHLLSEIEPCNNCSLCREINQALSMDVLEIDGASHRGIEDIRRINETCAFLPAYGKYKIYLIDEVHMLTKEAFNALLKTLEEPPEHVKFFFATTEVHKLPATILSRCQRFNLQKISQEKIVAKLKTITAELQVEADEGALIKIAAFSKGGMRDAESLLDQLIVFCQGKVTENDLVRLLGLPQKNLFFSFDLATYGQNLAPLFEISKAVLSSGTNLSYFLQELIDHFRTLLLLKSKLPVEGLSSQELNSYQPSLIHYEQDQLLAILHALGEAQTTFATALSERIWLEQLLLKILQIKASLPLESLVKKLIDLEQKLSLNSSPSSMTEEKPKLPVKTSGIKEQSRHDTLMRFATKELNGSLQQNNPVQ